MTLRAGHAGLTFRHRPVWSDLRWRSESQTSAARRAKRGQHIWTRKVRSKESEHFGCSPLIVLPMRATSNRIGYKDYPPQYPISKESTQTDIEGMKTAYRLEHGNSKWQACGGLQVLTEMHGQPQTNEHKLALAKVRASS